LLRNVKDLFRYHGLARGGCSIKNFKEYR